MAVEKAKDGLYDVLLVDTAGRLTKAPLPRPHNQVLTTKATQPRCHNQGHTTKVDTAFKIVQSLHINYWWPSSFNYD